MSINFFSIAMQILWKFCFVITFILTKSLLQIFAQDMAALLPWHVQKFDVIWWLVIELKPGKISIKFELWARKSFVR